MKYDKKLIEINNYWLDKFDWLEENVPMCFVCGKEHYLDKCHLIPNALGGTTDNDNIVLLCHNCHTNAPNINIKDIMINWIYEEAEKYNLLFHIKNESVVNRLDNCLKITLNILQGIKNTKIDKVVDTKDIMDFIKYKFKNNTVYISGHINANEVTTNKYYEYLATNDNLINEFIDFFYNKLKENNSEEDN